MSDATKGYAMKQVFGYKGFGANATVVCNVARAVPQTTTSNIFTVTGSILVVSLVGVISTALGAVAQSPTLGVSTGSASALASAPSVAWNANAAGGVIVLPATLGGQLPAIVTASEANQTDFSAFAITNASVTMTSGASTTGNITWILTFIPSQRKVPGSVVNA